MLKAIIIGIIITIIGLAVMSGIDKANGESSPSNSNNNLISSNESNSLLTTNENGESEIKVSISGEVLYPGDYYLSTNATLIDLINAAGGLTSKADNKAFNPSVNIINHTSFYIPPTSEKESSCVETSITKVNINSASTSELVSAGFTSTQSKAIVDYRNENGKFLCIEDIISVKGIGQGTFEKVKNKISIS